MTNCPNCGAPYKLHSRVCEYCGTVREKLPDEIRVEQELEQARMDVEQAKQNLCLLQFETAHVAQFDGLVQSILHEEVERRKFLTMRWQTAKPESVEAKQNGEQLSPRNILKIQLLLLAFTLLGRFATLLTEIETAKFICGYVYSGGITLLTFVSFMSAILWILEGI